jgi:hypothetical protein
MRGLVLASLALLMVTVSGCISGSADKYFPPARDLPDGLVPVSTESSEWKLAAPFLGMQTNPGRVSAFDSLPKHDLGTIAEVEAYLLQGPEGITTSYGILVLTFNGTADIGSYLAQGESHACDGKDMSHVLKDGLVYVLIGGDGSKPEGKQAIDDLTQVVQDRSGANRLC